MRVQFLHEGESNPNHHKTSETLPATRL